MDMMGARFRMMAMIGGGNVPFGGNNLKYIIPIEFTMPTGSASPVKKSFYVGLSNQTEYVFGALFQPGMNDDILINYKAPFFNFGAAFFKGGSSSGYLRGWCTTNRFTTAYKTSTGTAPSNIQYNNPDNSAYIEITTDDIYTVQNLMGRVFKGFILVFDTDYTGNAQYKQLTDAGMSVYYSETSPT